MRVYGKDNILFFCIKPFNPLRKVNAGNLATIEMALSRTIDHLEQVSYALYCCDRAKQ